VRVYDFSPALRQAIVLTREAGLTESATEHDEGSLAAYTTSSEWLAEVGDAILQFGSREGKRVPTEVADLLDECLKEIGKVWPKYKPKPTSGEEAIEPPAGHDGRSRPLSITIGYRSPEKLPTCFSAQ
jgi:hypothetical protein